MHACPCGETDIDQLDPMDSGLLYCDTCRQTTRPGDTPRLVEPPPTPEQRRKDLQ